MNTIEFNAEERGDELNGYIFRAIAVIGAVRQLYHATDTHPYFRAGFSANMYLKLTPEFNSDKKGNTYDGIALIRDESIPDDEIHYISDDTRILKITNMRKG